MKLHHSNDPTAQFVSFFDESLNRREFLRFQLKGALWLAAGTAGFSLPQVLQASESPYLSVVKGAPGPATRAAVEQLGGMKAFVKPGDKVVVKPNMSFANGVTNATNTRPEVVRELVAMVKEAGASRVRVLDNTLMNSARSIAEIKDACSVFNEDITHAVGEYKHYKPTRVSDKWFGFKKTDVMKEVLAADCLIAAPTAKSHHATGVSLSMKGMMGLVFDRYAMHQQGLHSAIVTLAAFLKPKLVVVDVTRVLSTNGPRGPGEIIPMNTIVASPDMVAADAQTVAMCTWNGRKIKPHKIKHIRLAHKEGLGRMDIENLSIRQIQI